MPKPAQPSVDPADLPEVHVGAVRSSQEPQVSAEERSVHHTFCELHHLPPEEVRVAPIEDLTGKRVGIVLVVSLEVLRSLARSSGKFSHADAPEFVRDAQGLPAAATVRVYRTDLPRGSARTAFWHERAPHGPRSGAAEGMAQRWWSEPDSVMAELAEALALRGAFPQVLEGIYTELDLPEAVREYELRHVQARHELRRQLEALR